jgi:hypothetical protein
MPEVRLTDHFKEFHVSVNHTIDVTDFKAGIIKGLSNGFMDHFRLVDVFPVTGELGFADSYNADISVFLLISHKFVSPNFPEQ